MVVVDTKEPGNEVERQVEFHGVPVMCGVPNDGFCVGAVRLAGVAVTWKVMNTASDA